MNQTVINSPVEELSCEPNFIDLSANDYVTGQVKERFFTVYMPSST